MRRTQHPELMFAACISMLVVSACARDKFDEVDTFAVGGDVAVTLNVVRVSDIIDHPDRYLGDTVTIVAEIDDVLNSFAFTLDENAFLAGGLNSLLVLSPKNNQVPDMDDQWHNDSVRVTGTVWRSSVVALEGELDRDLTPELESRIEARPVVIAHRVERIASR